MDSAQQTIDQPSFSNTQPGQISQVTQKALYSTSSGEIFWKNFLAGFARSMGWVVAQLIFFGLMYLLFINLFAPQIKPLLDLMERSVNSMEGVQRMQEEMSGTGSTGSSEQIDLNQILKQLETTR